MNILSSSPFFFFFFFFLLLILSIFLISTDASDIGICYGRVADNLPPPTSVVGVLKSNGISKVRLFNPEPTTLAAFKDTGIQLMIGVPNENLTYLDTGGPSAAASWLQSTIFSYVPPQQVRYLVVGNEVLLQDSFYAPHLVPALRNLQQALQTLRLAGAIKLSTAHAATVVQNTSPPSAAVFDSNILPTMQPLLQFLADTGAPFMVNVYPYFSYAGDPVYVPLPYTLSAGGQGVVPVQDGSIAYTSMFDAAVDAVYAAMEKQGFGQMPITVTETGWPTAGGPGATPENALIYNGNIVGRVGKGDGTPRRSKVPLEVFLFGLFDENQKPGAEYEKHFGIFNLDGSKAYNINFV